MLKTYKLKNGIKVATYSIPQMRSSTLTLNVKGGSVFDTPQNNGVAHFMEHILVQGIPSYPNVESLSDFVESIAGDYGASTYRNRIHFSMHVPVPHIEDQIKISYEVFFKPLFPEDSMERERQAVLEEIKERQSGSSYKMWRFQVDSRFKKNHPFQLDGGGSIDSVNNLQKKDLQMYWSQFFYPKNTYLTVVGGFKNMQLKKLIEKYFNEHKSTNVFPGFPSVSNADLSDRGVFIREDTDLKTSYLNLSFASITDKDPLEDQITQSIIRSILGGLRRSRLYRLLRQRRGLVYDVSFWAEYDDIHGLAGISSQMSVEKIDEVLKLIVQTLSGFIKSGPTQEELELAKNYAINQVLMRFDHPSGIGSWIEDFLMWEDKIYTPEEYTQLIRKVDTKKISDFMKKYWDFAKLNLVIQGPIKNSKQNINKFINIIKDIR